jgi:hypothetical protein
VSDDLKNKITEDFGLSGLEGSDQERMIDKIGTLLFESVVERSVDKMDDATINDFSSMLDGAGNDYQVVLGFLKERVGGFSDIVADELTRLKRTTSGILTH